MSKQQEERDISVIVGVFVQNENEEFLFFRMPKWGNKWSVCGGHVTRNETLADAALRELQEETDIKPDKLLFMSYTEIIKPDDYHADKHFIGFNFRVHVQGRPVVKTNDELGEQRWMTVDEALQQEDLNSMTRLTLEQLKNRAVCDSCEDLRGHAQRALADYQNLKREVEAKRADWVSHATMSAVDSFLPVYENMKKALAHTPSDNGGAWKAWAQGCQHVVRQFGEVFSSLGIEPIKTVGVQFNPEVHEAVAQKESDKPSGEIIEEVESGFTMGNKILKVAKVILSK